MLWSELSMSLLYFPISGISFRYLETVPRASTLIGIADNIIKCMTETAHISTGSVKLVLKAKKKKNVEKYVRKHPICMNLVAIEKQYIVYYIFHYSYSLSSIKITLGNWVLESVIVLSPEV